MFTIIYKYHTSAWTLRLRLVVSFSPSKYLLNKGPHSAVEGILPNSAAEGAVEFLASFKTSFEEPLLGSVVWGVSD